MGLICIPELKVGEEGHCRLIFNPILEIKRTKGKLTTCFGGRTKEGFCHC